VDLSDPAAVAQVWHQCQPDAVVHLAADLGRDAGSAESIVDNATATMRTLVELAQPRQTPFVFTSSEAIYGGRWELGQYSEEGPIQPRSPYGESKVACEQVLRDSGLPYLITRTHRYVGGSRRFHRPKQFPDALASLRAGQSIHCDPVKVFTPVLINHLCQVIAHYLTAETPAQVTVNVGVDQAVTFAQFMRDVATAIGANPELVITDGNEAGWPANSSLTVELLVQLGYPTCPYKHALEVIAAEVR
jgi:dTDP-4-dehydrorhamnose reductase